jgi:hypothetical protein
MIVFPHGLRQESRVRLTSSGFLSFAKNKFPESVRIRPAFLFLPSNYRGYSQRSAVIGSTRDARRAGNQHARIAAINRTIATAT